MFENLTDKLQRAFKNLRGQGTLNDENIGEALKEIRMALLEADVNFNVVKELIEHIREKAGAIFLAVLDKKDAFHSCPSSSRTARVSQRPSP